LPQRTGVKPRLHFNPASVGDKHRQLTTTFTGPGYFYRNPPLGSMPGAFCFR
jgi:hypothetical protein